MTGWRVNTSGSGSPFRLEGEGRHNGVSRSEDQER